MELGEAFTRIRIHQARAGLWFLTSFMGLFLSSMFAIPAKGPTAWQTLLINWQSNLLLYFAGASLILSLANGVRAFFFIRQVKRRSQGR